MILHNVKYLFIALMIVNWTDYIKAQDIFLKVGVGFYSLYENNILQGRERNISINPTLITSAGLTWQLSDLIYLSWENSFRFKSLQADFIGLDSTNNRKGIKHYVDFEFPNIDSKVIGKFAITEFNNGKILVLVGTGISWNITYHENYTLNNPNIVLKLDNEMPPDVLDGNPFKNSGFLTELGIEARYKSFSCSLNSLIELFNAELYNVGDNKAILTQIIVMYNL